MHDRLDDEQHKAEYVPEGQWRREPRRQKVRCFEPGRLVKFAQDRVGKSSQAYLRMDSLREELKQRLPWRRSATREVAETY